MTEKIKLEVQLSIEWLALADLATETEIKTKLPVKNADFDQWLVNKLTWFLYNGPAGTLYLIKEVFGDKELDKFIQWLLEYIQNPGTPKHYYPSDQVIKRITEYKESSKLIDFDQTLSDILNQNGNDGDKDG
ncbi:MAG: hypothetical protein E6336_01110 [Lactobacillus crispatus]|nr:hypothetical protein [Lactobacillus crispatus]